MREALFYILIAIAGILTLLLLLLIASVIIAAAYFTIEKIRRKLARPQKKPFLKGFAVKCSKCGSLFNEGDTFFGAYHADASDEPMTFQYDEEEESLYMLNGYILDSTSDRETGIPICNDCFNRNLEKKAIKWDGYDHICVPKDFLAEGEV